MAEVNLTIHGRNYGISCQDGQEQRVVDLGAYVDERINTIAASGAATNENQLLVLTALMLADEAFDLRDNAASQGGASADSAAAAVNADIQALAQENEAKEAEVAGAIDQLATRIDQIAKRIQAA